MSELPAQDASSSGHQGRRIQLGPRQDRVLILTNRKSGARSGEGQIGRLTELLREHRQVVEIIDDAEQLETRSHELHDAGDLRCVVAAGGDGTVALVANRTPPGAALAVLPLGTENLLAKYLDIGLDPRGLCETIVEGCGIRLDAGEANGRLFVLMLGCGFDAEVVRRLDSERTGHITHRSYAKPIWGSLRSYRYPELRVYCADPSFPVEVDGARGSAVPLGGEAVVGRWVFVVNLPKYALGLQVAPDAVGTDGLLDVCTFARGNLLHGLRYLTGVALGIHTSWGDFKSVRTSALHIESDEPVPYQMDGDPGGFLPVEVRTLPFRLTMLVSRKTAARLQSANSG